MHTWEGGHISELGLVRSQRDREVWARVFVVVSKEKNDKAGQAGLELVSLNNFMSCGPRAVPCCLVAGPGVIRARG